SLRGGRRVRREAGFGGSQRGAPVGGVPAAGRASIRQAVARRSLRVARRALPQSGRRLRGAGRPAAPSVAARAARGPPSALCRAALSETPAAAGALGSARLALSAAGSRRLRAATTDVERRAP